jgi:hypothetical protein
MRLPSSAACPILSGRRQAGADRVFFPRHFYLPCFLGGFFAPFPHRDLVYVGPRLACAQTESPELYVIASD